MDTYILDIQRMSTEDGPGIRTTVFFKGCNLKCVWCHNPESIVFYKQKYWIEDRCIGCHTCVESCPNSAISFNEQGIIFDEKLCSYSLNCVEACPANAIEVKGKSIGVEPLVYELLKDKAYFEASGGGITLSGGEAVLQWEYLLPLVKSLKEHGLHIALDTAGNYPYTILEKVLPYLDLILYDIKIADKDLHKKYTGVENILILQNAKRIGKLQTPKIWIRTPIVPGFTDDEQNIRSIASFIKENMPDIERWELLAFNNLSKGKYRLLGKAWDLEDVQLMEKKKMEELCKLAKNYTKNVMWSGATRLEV